MADPVWADFVSLQTSEENNRIDVRCRFCDTGITFYENATDPILSTYACRGSWKYGYGMSCENSRTEFEIRKMSKYQMYLNYYVNPPIIDEIWVLKLEEHVGKQAFHYLAKGDYNDKIKAGLDRLEFLRKKAMK